MWSVKDYALLCELARTGLLPAQQSGGVLELTAKLETKLAGMGQGDLAQQIGGSANLVDWEWERREGDGERPDRYFFVHKEHKRWVVVMQEPSDIPFSHTYSMEEFAAALQRVTDTGGALSFTGLGQGGWRAAELAAILGAEAVVFGAPGEEELPGTAVNYVGEDDPVGASKEKVVFVKQQSGLKEEDEAFYYRKLEFDDEGSPVVAGQSEFSRFVSWFYQRAGTVEPDIWGIFFPGPEEEGALLADLGVYSVYLQIGSLNREGILRSVDETIRHAGKVLTANREVMVRELAKVGDEDYHTRVPEIAGEHAARASSFVERTFDSVQTIFMGIALFSLDQGQFDVTPWMAGFYDRIHELLDREQTKLEACLDQAIASHMERLLQMPDFTLDW
ncbi:hypothetical protein [Paenibacillus sanfengchensis]|uniref:hypothetical protein n=1 Tax=Paenibacillus sanfengchensis TaxID=3119819 RepID=UPI002FE38153